MLTNLLYRFWPAAELNQLYGLFPAISRAEVAPVIQLLPLGKEVHPADGRIHRVEGLVSEQVREVITQEGSQVRLPYRVYFAEPLASAEQCLSDRQQAMLCCLYLRHHNGFVRQRRLEQLLAGPLEAFATPFIFSLIGEYVQEILAVLETRLTAEVVSGFVGLIQQNPRYWQQTQGRVASYWDVYYRQRGQGSPGFSHYVGYRLLKKLRAALRAAALPTTE